MTAVERQTALERISIRNSISNLRTFPCVKILEERGKLRIHGAWFDISNGELWHMDPQTGTSIRLDGQENLKYRPAPVRRPLQTRSEDNSEKSRRDRCLRASVESFRVDARTDIGDSLLIDGRSVPTLNRREIRFALLIACTRCQPWPLRKLAVEARASALERTRSI